MKRLNKEHNISTRGGANAGDEEERAWTLAKMGTCSSDSFSDYYYEMLLEGSIIRNRPMDMSGPT